MLVNPLYGGIVDPVYHHVVTNIQAEFLAEGIICQSGPTHMGKEYSGPQPPAGQCSSADCRYHYTYMVFAQNEYTAPIEPEDFDAGSSLESIMEKYGLTPVEQLYFLVSADGCEDGEDVCEPCPETNPIFSEDTAAIGQCTDLCEDPTLQTEFVAPCYENCERLCPAADYAQTSDDSSGSAAATVGIVLAAVAAVAATVAGAVKYRKPASDGGHVQLLNASTLSELDDELTGASVASFHIEPSVASV